MSQLNLVAIKGMRKSDSFGNLGKMKSDANEQQNQLESSSATAKLKNMRWGIMCVFQTFTEMRDV